MRSSALASGADGDVAEGAEREQIIVAGDDQRSLGGDRAGEHVVIVGIVADGGWQGLRFDEGGQAAVVPHDEARGREVGVKDAQLVAAG
jgi:hypothetical protein